MRNCLILGSGRSGTSMVAGCLAKAGYAMGERQIRAAPGNPLGYFESADINDINEDILQASLQPGWLRRRLRGWIARPNDRLLRDHHWLARVGLRTRMVCPVTVARRIAAQTDRSPFCFKDPRFCYTLPAWRPFLKHTALICVFRDPARTVNSILRDGRTAAYLRMLPMTRAWAEQVWVLMYRHVIERHARQGDDWLFLHYDQVMDGSGLDRLADVLDAPVDRAFPTPTLTHAPARGRVSRAARRLYRRLCARADYRP